jgi:hypothetical protein
MPMAIAIAYSNIYSSRREQGKKTTNMIIQMYDYCCEIAAIATL